MIPQDAAPTSLKGKTCLVTGANGGIGSAAADHFAALGARVMTTDVSDSYMGEADADHRALDLMSDLGLAACQKWIAEECPDVLFNNAAVFDMGSILQADLEQYDRLFSLNVRAMYGVMQGVAQTLVKVGKAGSIINLASQAGHRGEALVAHYCASKAAVISYTQSAALALAEHKIRVNAISPGVIDTPMWEHVDGLFAKYENKAKGQKKREVGEAVPLGYMGKPYEIARVAVFLASDQSQYMTAQTLSVDGGNVLRM
ncbi:NAD(P)-dependent dehydrogenase (short-subunit alcohol dehydrogenase family) [Shimia isoporae]|uniref:NAD(P)-dependent dehydrogenase (Short-subunit alcohol dehydrogenase family) n=1 Tax=Shimia isoporae TaxID=647720 RepID=A0A4R1N4R2_9RHOB|nr:SDR family oxidoreductase [Shimia isoporae]TCK99273.1 NAD(P)-dependent dehydrogenase (short-subunit alcohol dehydrogenase family) [Shimia isoporae]